MGTSGDSALSQTVVASSRRPPQVPDLTQAKKGTVLGAMNRRCQAFELRIAGLSYRRIARTLGVSTNQAFKDVQTMLGDLPILANPTWSAWG